jgi:integrase
MASIYQRGKRGTWWIKYYASGKQVHRSLKTTNAREAQRAKRLVEGEEAKGELIAPSSTPLPEFLAGYCRFLSTIRTAKSYKNDLSVLRMIFGPACDALQPGSCVNKRWASAARAAPPAKPGATHIHARLLEELTPARIEDLIARRIRQDGIAPKTANLLRGCLHRMFNFAIKTLGFVAPDRGHPNPAAAVERRSEQAQSIRFLTLPEIQAQLKVLRDDPTLLAMAAMYIYAGLRRSEALWLTVEDMDLDRRLLHVRAKTVDGQFWQPKTKRNRVVPISEDLLSLLADYQPQRTGPWFFPSPAGRRWDPDNYSQTLRELNKAHGLKWSCLDFRHTFGSHLAQKGESLYKIATLMGNSEAICQKHYAALVPEKMHDAVEFAKPSEPDKPQDPSSAGVIKHLLEKIELLEAEKLAQQPSPRLRIAR